MPSRPRHKEIGRQGGWGQGRRIIVLLSLITPATYLVIFSLHKKINDQTKNSHDISDLPPRHAYVQSDFFANKKYDDLDPSSSEMGQLNHISYPHGRFFFGVDSHRMKIPESEVFDRSTSWSSLQRELLDDSEINVENEKKRCASYNFEFPNATMSLKRRRLFYGALISNDSNEVIEATSMEQYNIFHTVSLIESNTTQNLTPKKWRFFGSEDASKKLKRLYQLYGPKTKVSVDYYVTSMEEDQVGDFLYTEGFQREAISHRWKFNGMKPEDVAIIGDLDETFSRDFLRALQICDVPLFRPGQSCKEPKMIASTLVFESSPECAWKGRRWYHPDAMLGECVDLIGDTKMHPPTKRTMWESHGPRLDGYGHDGDYSKYKANVLVPLKMESKYPLWRPNEFRQEIGGVMISKNDEWNSPTGYHFHNFFMSGEEIRFKYSTYGHADPEALEKPLRDIHDAGDLALAVTCAHGNHTDNTERSFESIPGSARPIYYLNEEARRARHSVWQDIVREDEEKYAQINNKEDDASAIADKLQTTSKLHWDSSKSAVLGLATGYPLGVYETFVGSLRATGFAGHIILAIAQGAPSDIVSYLSEQNVTIQYVETAEKCTYNGTIGEKGVPIDMQKSDEWHCPKDYPDYKITWARFLYYRDWLNACPSCTDGVILTDVRDAFFQRDPFVTALERKQVHPLMVFQETPDLNNEHWLTDWPVNSCRNHTVGKTPMLCSGSVMGSREGILDYINVMEEEFKYWMQRENCRIDHRGDDQSIHNYLYYTNRFKNAVSIPHRQGPIHVIGYQAARIFENATKEAEDAGVDISQIYNANNNWKEWLPSKYDLIDPTTGLIINEDGTPSAQVHQVDRFGPLISNWENEMKRQGWPYNKDDTTSKLHWNSSKSAVLGLATGYPLGVYETFVGSLRATGFAGHIILAIAQGAPSDIVSYLSEQNVTIQYVETAEKCTYNGTIGERGVPIDMQKSREWHCPKDYPDYKITWARFLYYRDWLNACPSCTDGVILTDVRDAFFQRDPFVTAMERKQVHPLMVFQETPDLNNEHWLTNWPVNSCRKHTVGKTPVLCSGSVMGSREGILDYINVMEEEFKYWMQRENCRIDNRGDDQSIHNYLYYTNRFKNAVSIPHRQGPIHVIGYQAARIFENATKEAEDAGVDISQIYNANNNWKEWLPSKYDLIDPTTGLIINEDGTPSAQVHQVDRFGPLISNWENEMKRQGWPYNKDDTTSKLHWNSSKSAVLGLATGYPLGVYETFVGSLRATGFAGHIILAIAQGAPSDIVSYLSEQNVTIQYVETAEKCTYNGTIGERGVPIDMQKSREWHCPKDYPDYKITWARFLYYRDWLNACPSCTDGVILTDVRDAFFQRDPFVTAMERKQVHPLMVFQETPDLNNEHWLTNWPVNSCRKHTVGKTPVLCSGSVMGSREGILDYINVMEEEFKYWMQRENCRIDNRGDDQSIHNYLYYTNRFKNAVSIPHRQGPIHVIGYQAARIFENATKEAEDAGVDISQIYNANNNWKEWLPSKYDLIDPTTGLIINEDGTPSAQVHQVDRFGPLISNWENEMKRQGWPYNKDDTTSKLHWNSSKSAVLGLATGYPLGVYETFVGSLRATGFAGHIILAIAQGAPSDIVSYLSEQNVTIQYVETAEKCTYNGTIGERGVPIDMQKSREWHCPKDYPDYKITWARFLYYRDWLNACPSCTDGVILTDVRDAFFQRDPFVTAMERKQVHPLMVFQETPDLNNEHWLTNWPVNSCRKHTVGKTPVLCSGSVMGSREGILDYINVMEEEFKYWMQRENCRIDNRGDDQSIHNYLYYTNRFKNAVSIPHRQGPIHVIGYQAARIFENATKEAEDAGVDISQIYNANNNWKEWLPSKYDLIDPTTGLIINEDGTPSAQVHQVDRFGPLISNWENEMKRQGWPYNKEVILKA